VGRNGVGKTQLLRLLAGQSQPAFGHIESAVRWAYVAQQHTLSAQTTLAQLLGYGEIFAALERVLQGRYQEGDLELLDGQWDL
ncbi:ATP-binding cassette domain-containing protein, partial [Klebsiella oxytoca]|uniref:ATP-binding cassette domain-containing protein n=1 Tax=Klebsiella oxytoca TaxID=571 RepID=UPI00109215A9